MISEATASTAPKFRCCYITLDSHTRVSENGILFCSTNRPYNDLVSPYRTKGRCNITVASPFAGTEPKALQQYRTKNPSPMQNQGSALLEHNPGSFTGTEPRAALLEPNQGTLTGTEPKGRSITTKTKAFHEYRTKGRPSSKVLHQRPFTGTEPKTALMVQNQTRRIKFKKVSRYVL